MDRQFDVFFVVVVAPASQHFSMDHPLVLVFRIVGLLYTGSQFLAAACLLRLLLLGGTASRRLLALLGSSCHSRVLVVAAVSHDHRHTPLMARCMPSDNSAWDLLLVGVMTRAYRRRRRLYHSRAP